jgi:hypothetical protein
MIGNAATQEWMAHTSQLTDAFTTPVDTQWSGPVNGERFLFRRGTTELRPGHEEQLRAFARTIPAEARLVVHGMASEEGSAAYNQNLSRRRAIALIAMLDRYGVAQARTARAVAHGEVPGDRATQRAAVVDLAFAPRPQATTEPPVTPAPAAFETPWWAYPAPSDLGVKFEKQVESPYFAMGPVKVRLVGKVSVEAAVKGQWDGTKWRFNALKATTEVSKALESEAGKFAAKYTDGKIAVEWGSKGSPLQEVLGKQAIVEISSPVVKMFMGEKVNEIDLIQITGGRKFESPDLSRMTFGDHELDFGLPSGATLPGTLTFKGGIGVVPNAEWWAKRAAQAAAAKTVAGATALEVATGVALPVGMIAFVGYGLYELNEAHERGRVHGMRLVFAQGYAETLVELTNPSPYVPGGERLLELDAAATFAAAVDSARRASGPAFAEEYAAREAGRAAAAQAVVELINRDPEVFDAWRRRMRDRYGQHVMDRGPRFRAVLFAQAKGEGPMGIDLEI